MQAMEKGRGAIVSTPPAIAFKGKTIVYVRNTLKSLQDIARYVRTKRGVTVIGVTGTNGKTTTKELIASILGRGHRVMKNSGNLNNHIGLPLSLTRIGEDDEYAVMEMGASIRGDIKELCGIAVPEYGVITNIGPGHLEGFGNLEGVRDTKLELFDAVRTIVVNADDGFLMEGIAQRSRPDGPKVITFGIGNPADVFATDIVLEEGRSLFSLCMKEARCSKTALHVNGRFNISNALAAAAVCSALGVGPEDITAGIRSFEGVPMRLEMKSLLGATIISDMYNANPASMEEAIRELVRLKKRRAIAVLGDMLELGTYAEEAHRKLGRWMSPLPVDVFIAVGPLMAKAAEEFSADNSHSRRMTMTAHDSSEARGILLGVCSEGDTVLVKGSRGMHMERILEDAPGGATDFMLRGGNAL
jgi:UDP-N-acetylmuramoyl-tripeptide--D-alanyl-D-alanine ligase